jgi:GntR family transcriptional regulator
VSSAAATPPKITVDPTLPTPPYEQVRQQIADLITASVLAPGLRLPPVRQLAGDLSLAVGTVARAYQELEAVGLVVTRRGGGTTVLRSPEPGPAGRTTVLAARAREYAATVRRIGASDEEAVAAVRAALAES